MQRSTDRILTTHVGSLIRPAALREFLAAKEAGQPFDKTIYAKCLKASVAEVGRKQAEIGIDVISDGASSEKRSAGHNTRCSAWAASSGGRLAAVTRLPVASTARALRSSTRSSMHATKSKPSWTRWW
jgi:hypothetical protein